MTYTQIVNSAPAVLVEFYASWCPHCQRMMPIVDQIKELLQGKAKVYQYDIDHNQDLAKENEVESIPTFIVYSGGKEQWRHTGEMDASELLAKIQQYT